MISSTLNPTNGAFSHFFQLVIFPLCLFDVLINFLLFIYTMLFQSVLFAIYIGLFIICSCTGQYDKLEKPGDPPLTKADIRRHSKRRRKILKECKKKYRKNDTLIVNDSGFCTDIEE